MARTRTLSEMLTDIRQRTNQENSTFVTDAEITEYLNQELAELYARIVQAQGQVHYRSSTSFSVVPGTALYTLPADFWQLQSVEALIGGRSVRLRPFMNSERARLTNAANFITFQPVQYRLQGNQVEFLPASWSFSATVFYTPAPPRLVLGADQFDGFAGWEIAAIYGACATVLQKEESDASFYLAQRDRIYVHIESLAAQRDDAEPERIQDVTRSIDMLADWGFGR